MPSNHLLQSLRPRNFLSFGSTFEGVDLGPLNILIGPNGVGKSNLIEAISILRATPSDVRDPIRRGGGVNEWINKSTGVGIAELEAVFKVPGIDPVLKHVFVFMSLNQAFALADEQIENDSILLGDDEPLFYYDYVRGNPVVRMRLGRVDAFRTQKGEETGNQDNGTLRTLKRERVLSDQSILSQLKDPETYPVLSALSDAYDKVRVYREWSFGRQATLRQPQPTDQRSDRLEENFSNLGLFVNKIRQTATAKRALLAALKDLNGAIEDFDVSIEGGTVQVFFQEGDYNIPAVRLSDGTLRYLCLAAILCDPTPPALVCIEEPELGLHPDLLPKLADLLLDASKRMQLIVTTHSDILVDAFTERPECVLVCDKEDGETTIRRLSQEDLEPWIREYRLGAGWLKGEIGGTRW